MIWKGSTLILLTYLSLGFCQNDTTVSPTTVAENTTTSIPTTETALSNATTAPTIAPLTCYSCPTGVATQVCANVAVPADCTNATQPICALVMRENRFYRRHGYGNGRQWGWNGYPSGNRGRGHGRGHGRNGNRASYQTFTSTCAFCNQYSNSTNAFLLNCCACSFFG